MASFIGVAPSRPTEAMTCTSTAATAAPRKATHRKSRSSETPKTESPTTMAKLAPALMPRIPGSASGLRVRPWSTAPARARAAPTASPSRVRSTRAWEMLCSGCDPSQTAASGIDRAPTTTDSTHATATAPTRRAATVGVPSRRGGVAPWPASAPCSRTGVEVTSP